MNDHETRFKMILKNMKHNLGTMFVIWIFDTKKMDINKSFNKMFSIF